MESSKSKIPSGITIDIESLPEENNRSYILGFSTSSPSVETTAPTIKSKDGFFTSNGKSFFFRIGLIIIILLFLGINIFSYLGDFFQNIKDSHFIQNILKTFGYGITQTTKEATEITAEGAKLGVDIAAETVESGIDIAAGTVESGIDVIQGQLDIDPNQSKPSFSSNQQQDPSLNAALAHAEDNIEPQPDDAFSSTQRLGTGKSGYCYIGEDRGFRSCIKVKEGDTCMSGEIFPSQQICVNPNLRE
jgi:hypothetical protein